MRGHGNAGIFPLSPQPSAPQALTIYSGLADDDIAALDALVSHKTLDTGDYLFHQHTPAKSVYMLEEGMLMMERSSSTGRRQVMAFMQPA